MFRWLVALTLIAGSSYFIYDWYYLKNVAPAQTMAEPGVLQRTEPGPMLSLSDIQKVKKSASDPDSGVRWSALELLFAFHDPDSIRMITTAIAHDPDADLRMKAVRLLRDADNPERVAGLVRGLHDTDREVRLEALKALGHVGDATASPWVADLLTKEPDAEVKTEALQALGMLQDRRRQDFAALSKKLREQYEAAVKKSQRSAREKDSSWNLE